MHGHWKPEHRTDGAALRLPAPVSDLWGVPWTLAAPPLASGRIVPHLPSQGGPALGDHPYLGLTRHSPSPRNSAPISLHSGAGMQNLQYLQYIIGIVAIVAPIAVSIGIYIKTNPRKRLIYSWKSSPLIAPGATVSVAVAIGEDQEYVPVHRPHLFEFTLSSRSRTAIGKEAFSHPIRIETDARLVSQVGTSILADSRQKLQVAVEDGELVIHPCVIERNDFVGFSALFEGDPSLLPLRGFRDVDVVHEDSLWFNRLFKTRDRAEMSIPAIAGGVSALLVSLVASVFAALQS